MFITQKQFFKKIDYKKYNNLKNNLCGLVNIFIILKNFGIKITEKEILEEALKMNIFDVNAGWKYDGLIRIFHFFYPNYNGKIKIFNTRFFHIFKLKKIFKNFNNKIFIASIKLDENHLIIIEKIRNSIIYYKSVGTKNYKAKKNGKIALKNFFKIYNKRGILIYK